jgi:hypothetical protein
VRCRRAGDGVISFEAIRVGLTRSVETLCWDERRAQILAALAVFFLAASAG